MKIKISQSNIYKEKFNYEFILDNINVEFIYNNKMNEEKYLIKINIIESNALNEIIKNFNKIIKNKFNSINFYIYKNLYTNEEINIIKKLIPNLEF